MCSWFRIRTVRRLASLCFAVAKLVRALPLLCVAGRFHSWLCPALPCHCNSSHCHALPLPRRSALSLCQAHPGIAVPLHDFSVRCLCCVSLCPCPSLPLLRCARQGYALAWLLVAARCPCVALLGFAVAHHRWSGPCLCSASLNSAVPLRFIAWRSLCVAPPFPASPLLCVAIHIHCLSMPSQAVAAPLVARLCHCHAVHYLAFAPHLSAKHRHRYLISSHVNRPLPLLRHWPNPLSFPRSNALTTISSRTLCSVMISHANCVPADTVSLVARDIRSPF